MFVPRLVPIAEPDRSVVVLDELCAPFYERILVDTRDGDEQIWEFKVVIDPRSRMKNGSQRLFSLVRSCSWVDPDFASILEE